MTIAEHWAKENSFFRSQVGSKIFPMLHQATAIVMDCRLKTDAGDEASPYAFDLFLRNALTALCDHAFPLGASRYRMHNGYAPQIGGTSGGYYSALVSTAPQVLAGQSKTPLRPLVFIINDKTPSLTPIPKSGQLRLFRRDEFHVCAADSRTQGRGLQRQGRDADRRGRHQPGGTHLHVL
jgi:hypothetical protein